MDIALVAPSILSGMMAALTHHVSGALIGIAPRFPPGIAWGMLSTWFEFFFECSMRVKSVSAACWLACGLVVIRSLCCLKATRNPRASVKPVCYLSALLCSGSVCILVMCAFGILVCCAAMAEVDAAVESVSQATADAEQSSEVALEAITALAEVCRSAPFSEGHCIRSSMRDLQEAREAVLSFSRGLAWTRSAYEEALPEVMNNGLIIAIVMATIIIVPIGLASVGVASLVCLARARGRNLCRCGGGCARFATVALVAPVVLQAAFFVETELVFGVAMASFCRDAEENSLVAVAVLANESVYNATHYYLTGVGDNPVTEDLRVAMDAVGRARVYTEIRAATSVRSVLQPAGASAFQEKLRGAELKLQSAAQALDREHMRPHYEAVIHGGMCEMLLGIVAWIALATMVLATLCLPLLASKVIGVFEARAAEQAALRALSLEMRVYPT